MMSLRCKRKSTAAPLKKKNSMAPFCLFWIGIIIGISIGAILSIRDDLRMSGYTKERQKAMDMWYFIAVIGFLSSYFIFFTI